MPGYSLVPVDYQPDFDNYSLVPVDHDPFAADDTIQRARTQQKSQPQPLANGTGQPNVGAPANNAQAAVADASYNPNSVSGGGSYGGGMADYSLIPVDYQPDFGDYSLVPVDYDPFIADDIIQRTRTQLASQPQPDAGFDQPPSAPQTPGSAPPLSPIVPNDGQAPSVPQPPGQDLHSQYQALRPMLGDRNAMLATAYPEVRQTLIAQALAGQQQPGQTSEPAPTGGVSGVTQQPPTPTQPAQPQPQQPATGAGQPGVNGPATGNSSSGSGGGVGVKRFGGDEGGHFPSRNAGIGFESADRAWYAALKEMRDLGAQYYPEEAKSRGLIPELGVEIYKRGGLYYYDQIARGFQDGALGGGVGLGDSGAVARGHMHWDSQLESKGDLNNAEAYSQAVPGYQAWVGSWDGFKLYWHNGKPTEPGMPDWNRYKY
jgi:hypothetical protein